MSVFVKIAKGELPSYRIYEDDEFLAILDINPISYGHTLVFPKKLSKDILDIEDDVLSRMILVVKKVNQLLKEKLNCDDFNIIHNAGSKSGQIIDHIHFHIIPRFSTDELEFKVKENNIDLKDVYQKIKGN